MSRRGARASSVEQLRFQTIAEIVRSAPLQLRFRVQRALQPPNRAWGQHWAGRTGSRAERRAWIVALTNALATSLGVRPTLALIGPGSNLPGAVGACAIRRRVTVQRLTPSVRNFLKDEDNQVFAEKSLYDALVELGLLKDDAMKWVERVRLPQAVSGDGTFWTHLTVEDLDA